MIDREKELLDEVKLRIQHLEFEKRRWKRVYRKAVAEINAYIKSCEATVRDLERRQDNE